MKIKLMVSIFALIAVGVGYLGYIEYDEKGKGFEFLTSVKERYSTPEIKIPENNFFTHVRADLGKKLFFDPRLSGSNWISCATCHNPSMGWSDGLQTGIGEGQKVLNRATPTILNVAYNFLQMWDGRFRSLEKQALGPIEAKDEMNQNLDELVEELKAIPGYVTLFNEAYPGKGISKGTIAYALSNFQRTIVSGEAPFDRWVQGDERAISKEAKRGFVLFEGKGHCSTCHSGFNFTDDGFHNIGLKSDDPGRYGVVPVAVTRGAFKTPTLRDIIKTAPYMHNGAYSTLEEVIDHYVDGGIRLSNLSPNFKAAELDASEKSDLIEFLKTLTSEQMKITIPRLPV